ncbi:hypothetical protein BDV27DRAFT_135053 [Aspergillus caelatus]|uniref:Uncharacterized protein n=1 Tax=Aspergillus caelatus TaxID=61420 RepID=A0A5N6ZT86_9EURO|nr:uncharacterized protein BDV27DRAFT_135053 [Aspergillus caelatus]KAE8360139.1 hypothetical protein BDV27DRAFT_135053 [Aspergillus caelatus]
MDAVFPDPEGPLRSIALDTRPFSRVRSPDRISVLLDDTVTPPASSSSDSSTSPSSDASSALETMNPSRFSVFLRFFRFFLSKFRLASPSLEALPVSTADTIRNLSQSRSMEASLVVWSTCPAEDGAYFCVQRQLSHSPRSKAVIEFGIEVYSLAIAG